MNKRIAYVGFDVHKNFTRLCISWVCNGSKEFGHSTTFLNCGLIETIPEEMNHGKKKNDPPKSIMQEI